MIRSSVGKFLFKRKAVVIGNGWNRLVHRGSIAIETHSITVIYQIKEKGVFTRSRRVPHQAKKMEMERD